MRILALDTATEACSVALAVSSPPHPRGLFDVAVNGICKEVGRGHAEEILAMIAQVLAEAGIGLSHVDGIAAGVGPGSFTGVRIGVAVAQGLAFGAGLPVIPVTTLEALALPVLSAGHPRVLACLDARMGEVYWGCFVGDAALGLRGCGAPAVGVPGAVTPAFAAPFRGVGRGFVAYEILNDLAGLRIEAADRTRLPDAADMARLGVVRLSAGLGVDAAALQPVYLRDKVALTELERGR